MGDGFVAKAWLADAGARASVGVEEVVFVVHIPLRIAAGLLQQDLPVIGEALDGIACDARGLRNGEAGKCSICAELDYTGRVSGHPIGRWD